MPPLSRIFGWMPFNGEEYVEVPDRPDPPRPSPGFFTFQTSQSADSGTRHSTPEASSPASTSSSLEGGFHSEPYMEPVRRGDPAWVARPRNPFIIFRCEYSREHTNQGKRVRRPPGSQAEKTLSKRAAEAWHQLSPEEKNRFKELAELEKEEHARLHPNYRFRPQKTKKGEPKKKPAASRSRSNSQPLTSQPATEPLVAAPMPRYPHRPTAPAPAPAPSPPPPPPPPPPVDMSAVKAGRRRSSSVPSLPVGQYPLVAGQWTAQRPRLEMKRSRSVMANRPPPLRVTNLASPYEGQSFDPMLLESTSSSGYYIPEESFGTVQSVSSLGEFSFEDHFSTPGTPAVLSPPPQVSPAPSMWNAEAPSGIEPTTAWTSPELDSNSHSLQYPEYSNSADAVLARYTPNDPWTSSAAQYPLTMTAVDVSDNSAGLFAASSAYETPADGSYPLQDYGHTLDPNSLENSADAMFALDINDLFQQHY
ncbi:putative high mobility group [Lyophyllum shimeji]|uniref:High mobility group n=1 Tax=Lyophyllum shimeji TaxID=47721 RepID=A0A9P3PGS6_LYOSH|nr:putative high mobility group [Lyophyllum shimeji]